MTFTYQDVPSGTVIPSTVTAVNIISNGVGTPATATLPADVANGTVIITATNDPEGLQVNGVGQSRGDSRFWVKTSDTAFGGDGWKSDF